MMSSPKFVVSTAQAVGLGLTAFLAGGTSTISFIGIPPILMAPSPLVLRQWDTIFERGKRTAPPLSLVSTASLAYLAYEASSAFNSRLYVAAAVLSVSIVPFTFAFIEPTNKKLKAKIEDTKSLSPLEELAEVGAAKGESAKELIDSWATWNFARTLFPLSAFGLCFWATLME